MEILSAWLADWLVNIHLSYITISTDIRKFIIEQDHGFISHTCMILFAYQLEFISSYFNLAIICNINKGFLKLVLLIGWDGLCLGISCSFSRDYVNWKKKSVSLEKITQTVI